MKKILSILLAASLLFTSCKFLNLNDVEETDYNKSVSAVTFNTSSLTLKKGDSEYLPISINPSDNQSRYNVSWTFDESFLSVEYDNFGAIVTALKEGNTYIKAKCNGIIATCLITVSGISEVFTGEPYIYSNSSVVELHPSDTTTVSSALYGGSIEDMENFEWSISNPDIATIDYSRNNCIITAKKSGSAKLVCSHPDARYDYTYIVYVYKDSFKEPYITTETNIVALNKNEVTSKRVTVSMVNPPDQNYKSGFVWSIDEPSQDIISIVPGGDGCDITPLKAGVARITVSHPSCEYDLEIIVHIVSIVKNVYIELDNSTLIVDGSSPRTVNAALTNYDGHYSPDSFTWDIPDEAYDIADCISSGNTLQVQGKKNGTFKVTVSNEYSELSRSVLVVCKNQIASAIDATAYITTSQNYVQTQVGRGPSEISVTLVGGTEGVDDIGDELTNFSWHISGGRNNDIVNIEQVTGVVVNSSRAAVTAASSGNFCIGKLVITPLRAGEVTITVTHPKCLYETDIVVKVYSESAIVNPKTLRISDSVIRLLNGSSAEVTAEVHNATSPSDEDAVTWSSADSSAVTVSPSTGSMTVVTATGSGSHQTYVTSHLDGALYDQKFLVLSADTSEELASMKFIYSDDSYLRLEYGGKKTVTVEGSGLSSSDVISWSSSNPSVCSVIPDFSSQNCSKASFTGNNAGNAVITASLDGCAPLSFTVTVLAQGESAEIFDENAGYLTTLKNAVVLEKPDEHVSLSVSGINIKPSDLELYTNWSVTDLTPSASPCFELSGTGSNVTLTSLKPGKSKIKVSNKYSSNELSIDAKCGEVYEWTDEHEVYITSDNDVVSMKKGESKTIACSLNSSTPGTFSWAVTEGSENIEIIGTASGTCIIKALSAGQSVVTVTSPQSPVSKDFLVNIANSDDELKAFRYLSTKQNVVTVGDNSSTSVSVSVINSEDPVITGFVWQSSDTSIADVVSSGSTAVIYGRKTGTAKLTVTNYEYCDYPLEIIVNVVNQTLASSDPYISCNNIVTCTIGSSYTSVSAELIGGTAADSMNFSWNVVDSSIATIVPSNDSVLVKAVSAGVTQIVVSHPKASVNRTILVVCEAPQKNNCYISLSDSIIKMSPSDPVRTISATLVNGDASDVYDFKWWADDYQHINMNYSGATCLVEPLSSGTVTIHVSHPLVAGQKDIILYISQYDDFSFEKSSVTIASGHDTFINMEVPTSASEYTVSYSSSNNELCSASGNNSVCILHPGVVKNGSYEACTITATLMSKGGIKQGEAQLLVNVEKQNVTLPFIGLSPDNAPNVINMNVGEKTQISAKLYSAIVDTSSAGLTWTINGADKIVDFVSNRHSGTSVQIQALNPGKTTITISHADDGGNRILDYKLYVIVAGVADSVLTLDATDIVAVMGEENIPVNASVTNSTGEKLVWSSSDSSVFTFTETSTKAYITPKAPGTAVLYCELPSTMTKVSCNVVVKDRARFDFFYYDLEDNYTYSSGKITEDGRNRLYPNTFSTYPGEVRILHYESNPPDTIVPPANWYLSDSNYFTYEDKGYASSVTVKGKTYYYPDNVGTILITGKANEGTASLKATSAEGTTATISCANYYNNLFRLSKSIVSTSPDELGSKVIEVEYELRPACSMITLNLSTAESWSNHIALLDTAGNVIKPDADLQWVIRNHNVTSDTATSGIVTGKLRFAISSGSSFDYSGTHGKGEVYADFKVSAFNENTISSTGVFSTTSVGSTNLRIVSAYQTHSFNVNLDSRVPYECQTAGDSEFSRYDPASNCIILGDGEKITCSVSYAESNSVCGILSDNTGIYFEKASGSVQADKIEFSYSVKTGETRKFTIAHKYDYGYFYYVDSSGKGNYVKSGAASRLYPENKFTDLTAGTEINNDSVRLFEYVGSICIVFNNFSTKKAETKKIPVYVQIRNIPCSGNNNSNTKYRPLSYSELY